MPGQCAGWFIEQHDLGVNRMCAGRLRPRCCAAGELSGYLAFFRAADLRNKAWAISSFGLERLRTIREGGVSARRGGGTVKDWEDHADSVDGVDVFGSVREYHHDDRLPERFPRC